MADRLGYSRQTIYEWLWRGWAADAPRRPAPATGRGGRPPLELWLATLPPPPDDARRGRSVGGRRARVVAAVLAAGGPPGQGRRAGGPFWARIGATVDRSGESARQMWMQACALGEVPAPQARREAA